MITLAKLNGRVIVSTGHTVDEAYAIKDENPGTLVHYITSDLNGVDIKVGITKVVDNINVVFLEWKDVKDIRQELLNESDWRDLPSYPGTNQSDWREYRSLLRNLPQDFTEVSDAVFPNKPTN